MPSKNNTNSNGTDPIVRRRRRLHRYLGLTAAIFLVLLVVSGMLLQHQQALGLDQHFTSSSLLLKLYDIQAPAVYQSCQTAHSRITRLGDSLFLQKLELRLPDTATATTGHPIKENPGPLRLTRTASRLAGCVEQAGTVIIATDAQLLLYSEQGEFIDAVTLPFTVTRIGQLQGADARVVLESSSGLFRIDDTALVITPLPNPGAVRWSHSGKLTPAQLLDLQRRYLGRVLSWQQLLRDLHSGQILGSWGKLFLDLVALGILFLAGSGIALWWRGRNAR